MLRAIWLALAVAGCAVAPPDDPRVNAEAVEPLVCTSRAQCDIYWQRAQVWVANNSEYRIRVATDVLIETFGPFGSKVDLAYRITRLPDNSGGARIYIVAACDNFIRCYPPRTDAIIAFKRFVRQ